MKVEIFRRMSMEINTNQGGDDNVAKKNVAKDKPDEKDDYLVKTIGAFGLWQAVVSITVLLTRFIAMWNMMSMAFLTPKVEFVCEVFSDNITIEVKKSMCYDSCLKYRYLSILGTSIVEDFGLICHNAWLASFTQSVLMMGLLFGASLFGWISDSFGRRAALLLSTFLNAVFMLALPFSPEYIVFICIRFIIGIATGGSLAIGVVHVMEIVGKRQREIAGACVLIPDGLSLVSLTGFAYFTSNWQAYTLSCGVSTCFIFVLMLFVPESPRWLVARGKVDEAVKLITRAANRNKLDTSNIKAEITKALEDMKLKEDENVKTSYLDFVKTKYLFVLTLTLLTLWFVQGLSYYGIYQYITIIGIGPYLTVGVSGVIQVAVCPVSVILNKRFRRKTSILLITTVIAILMLILIFVQKGYWLATMLGTLAFIFSNFFFNIAYVHLSELYPTPLRNMSYGLTSSGAKIGAIIAPFVANLSPSWLPSLIFCIFPLIGGLCTLTLPETKGQNLKDTCKN